MKYKKSRSEIFFDRLYQKIKTTMSYPYEMYGRINAK